jgi:uncharacterized SAM-binding protein YcdF (DUF218 family)
MNIDWFLTNAISALLLPPLVFVVPALFGLALRRWWPRFGTILCVLALLALVVLSTVAGARLLVTPLEARIEALSPDAMKQAQAIVVLGGGRHKEAAEYTYLDSPSLNTLGRLRYAAHLHKQTGLPLLVTGGRPDGGEESEAAVMARVLRQEFQVPVKWLEEDSLNTAQNAALSAGMLREAGIERILLVTDALHMPRAQQVFREQGLQVSAAPTYYQSHDALQPHHYIPGARGLRLTYYAMHEWIGLLWYRLRYGI